MKNVHATKEKVFVILKQLSNCKRLEFKLNLKESCEMNQCRSFAWLIFLFNSDFSLDIVTSTNSLYYKDTFASASKLQEQQPFFFLLIPVFDKI